MGAKEHAGPTNIEPTPADVLAIALRIAQLPRGCMYSITYVAYEEGDQPLAWSVTPLGKIEGKKKKG